MTGSENAPSEEHAVVLTTDEIDRFRDGPITRYGKTFRDYDEFLDWKHEMLSGWEDDE